MGRIWVGIVAVMALTGCGVWTSTPSVGDCAEIKDISRGKTSLSKVDCSTPQAMYKLVDRESGRSPGCPRGDYVEETSIRNRKTERRTRECYVLHVKEGECLRPVASSYERTACGGGAMRVSKVVEGKFDPALCGPGDDKRAYSRPSLTICISK